MKKKFLAMAMVTIMAASTLVGCSGGSDGKSAAKKDGKFYIYSWNTEVQDRISALYKAKYGEEEAKKLEFVVPGDSKVYQEKLDAALKDTKGDKYPDMFAVEADYIKKYTDADITKDLSEVGIKAEDFKDMYQYTLDNGKDKDGKLKGVSWQACPGGLVYRRSIAKKVFGTDDPAKVQEQFKDEAAMKNAAKTIAEKTDNKTRLFAGYSELLRTYQGARTDAWVKDDKLNIDKTMEAYLKDSKEYCDNKYALADKDTQQWADKWFSLMGDDSVFAYCSCTWFNQFTLLPQLEKGKKETIGDWAMIQGPKPYAWGGTWLTVTSNCSNNDIAKNVLSLFNDVESMKKIYTQFSDYPNNKQAVDALIAEEKSAKEQNPVVKLLGGQSALEFYKPIADTVKLPELSGEDFYANQFFNEAVEAYVTGGKDEKAAIEDFKKKMKDKYQNLKVD